MYSNVSSLSIDTKISTHYLRITSLWCHYVSIREKPRKRDEIRKEVLKGRVDVTYQDFTALRNEVQRDIEKLKASYFQCKLDDSMGNPKKLWEYLKNLGYSDKSKSKGKILLDINGQLCYDALSVCNYINGFFTNVASTLVSKLLSPLNKYSTDSVTFKQFYLDKGVTPNEFDLEQVSNDFMLKTLSNPNAHKGAGLDGLAPRFLKDGDPQIAPVVTHIVNLSIVTKTVPDDLDHEILCSKLECMGINPSWFTSYLSNRQQLVSVDGISSEFQKITCGVPLGSLLGPFL